MKNNIKIINEDASLISMGLKPSEIEIDDDKKEEKEEVKKNK